MAGPEHPAVLRILLTDASTTARAVAASLRDGGHVVFEQCFPDVAAEHVCTGIAEASCPLEEGVDVAVTSLEHHLDVASAGSVCARRAGVPLVTVGRHDAAHPDLVPALARIADLGDRQTRGAAQALEHRLRELGWPTTVSLHRRQNADVVDVTVVAPVSHLGRVRIAEIAHRELSGSAGTPRRRDIRVRVG